MGKTCKGKAKAAAKIAQAKRKIARKCKGAAALVLFLGLALVIGGCTTASSAQPAKSQSQHNEMHDCIFVMAGKAKIPLDGTNRVIEVEADKDGAPAMEMFTQTQALESRGTETYSPGNTQTPTTDVKPDLDVHYNDAVKNATDASKGVLDQLIGSSADAVLKLMSNKESGKVNVTKTDGSSAVVSCENGQCSFCDDCTP